MADTTLKSIRHPDGSYGSVDELLIPASQERIFDTLCDFNHRDKWANKTKARILTGEAKAELGSEIELVIKNWTLKIKITDLYRPERIGFQIIEGPFLGECEWQVIPEGKGSKARLIWKAIYPNTFFLKLVFLMTGSFFHSKAASRQLHALGNYLSKKSSLS